jgi:hypothetical protein
MVLGIFDATKSKVWFVKHFFHKAFVLLVDQHSTSTNFPENQAVSSNFRIWILELYIGREIESHQGKGWYVFFN